MTNTSKTVRISSKDQNMWASGDAVTYDWNEYFPIIGGEITNYTIVSADILLGTGKVTIDDGRIKFDAEGAYDNMPRGTTDTVIVAYQVQDEAGNITYKEAEIDVKGGDSGASFTHKDSGTEGNGALAFQAMTAAEMLQDVHNFERVVPVDIEFDALGEFADEIEAAANGIKEEIHKNEAAKREAIDEYNQIAAELGQAEAKAAHVTKILALDLEKETTKAVYETAKVAHAGAKAAYELWEDAKVEENTAKAAQSAAQGTLNAASAAVDAAEDLVNGAKNLLADAVGVINDAGKALGKFVGDVAYEAELLALKAWKALPFNDDAAIQRDIDALVNNKRAYDQAQRDKVDAQNDLNRFERDLRKEQADFSDAQDALNEAKAEVRSAIKAVESAWNAFSAEAGGQTVGALKSAMDAAYDLYVDAYHKHQDAIAEMHKDGILVGQTPDVQDGVEAAAEVTKLGLELTAKQAEIWGRDGYDAILETAYEAWDAITDTNVKAEVEVAVDAYAQAGLIVDFALDGGSVDTNLDFELTSNAVLDTDADTFTIAPTATNATTGESVAFETVSPNMTFFAGLAYHAGATFDILVDLFAKVAGSTVLDYPNGNDPLKITESVSIDGIVPLMDFDSRDAGFEFSPPGFLGDIISAEFNFPTIETEGKAADFDKSFYEDVTGTSLDQISQVILDLVDMRLEYSPEFQEILKSNGASTDILGNNLGTAITDALEAVFDSLDGSGDTDGDGYVPILMVKQEADGALFHINSIADDLTGLDHPDKAKFGFYVGSGKSDNVFQVNLDVDQLIATVVNVALGNTPESTINPLDLGFDLYDLFEDTGIATEAQIEAMKKFFNVEFNAQLADLDVRTGAGFRQDFALSIDDIDYQVTFEDGTTGSFSANDDGMIVFDNASDLVDTDGDGEIEYTLAMTPDAEFYNDTEVALNIGYTMDFIKANLDLAASLPLSELGLGLDDIDGWTESFSLGPVLRLDGELDLLSADVFEDRFDFNAGTGVVEGSFEVAGPAMPGVEDLTMVGNAQNNTMTGGAGNDMIIGKLGHDQLAGLEGNDTLKGGLGHDTLKGGAGDDLMIGAKGHDVSFGGAGADEMQGRLGNDVAYGGLGSDMLDGGIGRDVLHGQKGNDDLSGGAGRDILWGGLGNDELTGGAHIDRFVFNANDGQDVITDFQAGLDVIDIRAGADAMADLVFQQMGDDVQVSFGNTEVLVEDITVSALNQVDNFDF